MKSSFIQCTHNLLNLKLCLLHLQTDLTLNFFKSFGSLANKFGIGNYNKCKKVQNNPPFSYL